MRAPARPRSPLTPLLRSAPASPAARRARRRPLDCATTSSLAYVAPPVEALLAAVAAPSPPPRASPRAADSRDFQTETSSHFQAPPADLAAGAGGASFAYSNLPQPRAPLPFDGSTTTGDSFRAPPPEALLQAASGSPPRVAPAPARDTRDWATETRQNYVAPSADELRAAGSGGVSYAYAELPPPRVALPFDGTTTTGDSFRAPPPEALQQAASDSPRMAPAPARDTRDWATETRQNYVAPPPEALVAAGAPGPQPEPEQRPRIPFDATTTAADAFVAPPPPPRCPVLDLPPAPAGQTGHVLYDTGSHRWTESTRL